MKYLHWIVAAVGLIILASALTEVPAYQVVDRIGLGLGVMILARMLQAEILSAAARIGR
jgi:hypothetical protein